MRSKRSVRQYKYHLNVKWKKKRTAAPGANEQRPLRKRASRGNGATVFHSGNGPIEVDPTESPQSGSRLTGIVLRHWNLPYGALTASKYDLNKVHSPFGGNTTLPSVPPIILANGTARFHAERLSLLSRGKVTDLISILSIDESRVTVTWLHHFWMWAYSTTKHWSKISAEVTPELRSPSRILTSLESPLPQSNETRVHRRDKSPTINGLQPSKVCQWTAHHVYPHRQRAFSPTHDTRCRSQRAGRASWPTWPKSAPYSHIADILAKGLVQNSFSDIGRSSLPFSVTQATEIARKSPNEMRLESIGFAIMTQNIDLLHEEVDFMNDHADLSKMYPFHLAANHLSGGKLCCNMMSFLAVALDGRNSIERLYVNEMGYTVLDSLMLSILKSHTSCTPAAADSRVTWSWFDGEETDLCGRWDAESSCIIRLHEQDAARIPFSWKHVFCHTSAQTICHSIIAIFRQSISPHINTPSGLFVKKCKKCNQKLELFPLHTLTLVAFHLGNSGTTGETLFGAIACLLCMLMHDANPLHQAELSLNALFGVDDDNCNHQCVGPADLAECVPPELIADWPNETQLGWQIFVQILRFSTSERSRMGYLHNRVSCQHALHSISGLPRRNFFAASTWLGNLWTVVQTELLTYHRAKEGDPWLSSRFDMEATLEDLTDLNSLDSIQSTKTNVQKPLCGCGRLTEVEDAFCPTAEESCSYSSASIRSGTCPVLIDMPESRDDYHEELDD